VAEVVAYRNDHSRYDLKFIKDKEVD